MARDGQVAVAETCEAPRRLGWLWCGSLAACLFEVVQQVAKARDVLDSQQGFLEVSVGDIAAKEIAEGAPGTVEQGT